VAGACPRRCRRVESAIQDTASAPLGIVVTIAVVVAAVAREAPRLGRAQVGGVGARREESNEEFREHV